MRGRIASTSGNGTRLESCAIEGEDAVAVQAATQVPFAPWVVRRHVRGLLPVIEEIAGQSLHDGTECSAEGNGQSGA